MVVVILPKDVTFIEYITFEPIAPYIFAKKRYTAMSIPLQWKLAGGMKYLQTSEIYFGILPKDINNIIYKFAGF